jgi:hypothetical protein
MRDVDRVLQLFRRSQGKLISNSSISAGQYFGTKPILNWSARITDARDEIKCNCGQDETACLAQEHIRNVKKNWYQYVGKQAVKPLEPARAWVDVNNLRRQLEDLRTRYVTAEGVQKDIIRIQGQALKRSLDIQLATSAQVQTVMEALTT